MRIHKHDSLCSGGLSGAVDVNPCRGVMMFLGLCGSLVLIQLGQQVLYCSSSAVFVSWALLVDGDFVLLLFLVADSRTRGQWDARGVSVTPLHYCNPTKKLSLLTRARKRSVPLERCIRQSVPRGHSFSCLQVRQTAGPGTQWDAPSNAASGGVCRAVTQCDASAARQAVVDATPFGRRPVRGLLDLRVSGRYTIWCLLHGTEEGERMCRFAKR